jgi:hypothetical protein
MAIGLSRELGTTAWTAGIANTACKVLGVLLLVVGVVGFAKPDLMGTHLSIAHSIVHLVSGALAAYLGWAGSVRAASGFCLIFGAVYGLLGGDGLVMGEVGSPSADVPGPHDSHMLHVVPGVLELGFADHVIHVLLGIAFISSGILTRMSTS